MRNTVIGLAAAAATITAGLTVNASAHDYSRGAGYEGYSDSGPQAKSGRGEYRREFGGREYPHRESRRGEYRREFERREYPRREFGRREYGREFESREHPGREFGRREYGREFERRERPRQEYGRGEYPDRGSGRFENNELMGKASLATERDNSSWSSSHVALRQHCAGEHYAQPSGAAPYFFGTGS
jgi:hypothetical protein